MKIRNLGFLKYWTMSNIPLFLLAAPMLYILTRSAIWGCGWYELFGDASKKPTKPSTHEKPGRESNSTSFTKRSLIRQITLPQAALVTLTMTNFHVQIVTRLSSGYPVWYWWLASMMLDDDDVQAFGRRWKPAKTTVRWMIIYAIVQGGLFASFMPPA